MDDGWIEWFKVNLSKDFAVNPSRAGKYYLLDRRYNFRPDYEIPIGRNDSIRYSGKEVGGTNDRDMPEYMKLFGEFDFKDPDLLVEIQRLTGGTPMQFWPPELIHFPYKKIPGKEILYGGYDEAFAAGKTILELGSGRAIALMQFSERHPKCTFIGVDTLYDKKNKIFPNRPGLQLTNDNWDRLVQIPDKSVDTVISYQSLGQWGEEYSEAAAALTRVVRKGGTIWIEGNPDKCEQLRSKLDPLIWECKAPYAGFGLAAKRNG